MRRLLRCALLLALLAPVGASAQLYVNGTYQDAPTPVKGFGTLAVSNSSVAVSTLTAGPNSAAWAMPLAGVLYIKNSEASAGNMFVCPLGGNCTTAAGIALGPGAAYGFNLASSATSPTVIATSTATAVIQW